MPAKTDVERQRKYQGRLRAERKARAKMLNKFIKAFPGQLRFSYFPAEDPHGDLDNPVAIRIFFPDTAKPDIAAFALARDMSVDDLFDQLTIEMELRLKQRGMLPNVTRHLVE